MALRIVVVTALVLGGFVRDARAATWTEARSPHFTVYTDAGERRARNVAWQFEQIRATLQQLWPWATLDLGRPILVYAARDERSMRALVPGIFERPGNLSPGSVFVPGADAHYVAIRVDQYNAGDPTVNPFRSSYWSYVAMVLDATFERELPTWLFRGLTEVFSNTVVRDDEILIGPPIPWHLRDLQQRARPQLSELLGAERGSPLLATGDRMQMFDALSWALVHYLIFGNGAKNQPLFNEFADAVRRGADPVPTLHKLYGGATGLRDGLARYIDQRLFVYQRARVAVSVDARTFQARELPAADAAVALARLHAANGRGVEARAQLAAAGGAPARAEVEGLLLDSDDKEQEARAAYARASAAGAAGFYGEYRLALLSWPSDDAAGSRDDAFAAIERGVRRSLELNPVFAPAHALLANVLASRERHGEAMAAAKRAFALASTAGERRQAQRAIDALTKAEETAARNAEQKALFEACVKDDMAACTKVSAFADEACAKGHAQACVSGAFFHAHGRGVPKNEARAIAMLEPLCAKGHEAACKLLATLK